MRVRKSRSMGGLGWGAEERERSQQTGGRYVRAGQDWRGRDNGMWGEKNQEGRAGGKESAEGGEEDHGNRREMGGAKEGEGREESERGQGQIAMGAGASLWGKGGRGKGDGDGELSAGEKFGERGISAAQVVGAETGDRGGEIRRTWSKEGGRGGGGARGRKGGRGRKEGMGREGGGGEGKGEVEGGGREWDHGMEKRDALRENRAWWGRVKGEGRRVWADGGGGEIERGISFQNECSERGENESGVGDDKWRGVREGGGEGSGRGERNKEKGGEDREIRDGVAWAKMARAGTGGLDSGVRANEDECGGGWSRGGEKKRAKEKGDGGRGVGRKGNFWREKREEEGRRGGGGRGMCGGDTREGGIRAEAMKWGDAGVEGEETRDGNGVAEGVDRRNVGVGGGRRGVAESKGRWGAEEKRDIGEGREQGVAERAREKKTEGGRAKK
ncbi:hypothetical protein Tco_1163097 [Tanacetum coccineum]